jgi:hypothetical protein
MKKSVHLGSFNSINEAGEAYKTAATAHFGEFLNLSPKEPAPDPYTNTEGYIGPQQSDHLKQPVRAGVDSGA